MSDTHAVALRGQQSLDEQIFSRFVNLKVGVSLSGSQQFPAEELLELAGEGRLEKGREVTVTARFFVADTGLGITRTQEYGGTDRYSFGSGKVALKLVAIETLQVGEQRLSAAVAKLCSCVIPADGDSGPKGYRTTDVKGWLALGQCEECHGRGLLFPSEYDAPYAHKRYNNYGEALILVDELPEPKPVPEGHCPLCAHKAPRHAYECPESDYNKRQRELQEAEDGAEDPERPDCFGSYEEDNCPECTEDCAHAGDCREASEEVAGERDRDASVA